MCYINTFNLYDTMPKISPPRPKVPSEFSPLWSVCRVPACCRSLGLSSCIPTSYYG